MLARISSKCFHTVDCRQCNNCIAITMKLLFQKKWQKTFLDRLQKPSEKLYDTSKKRFQNYSRI